MTGFWKDRRVLIFGAGGFLGAQLARQLSDLGALVIGADRTERTPCWRVWQHAEPMLKRNGLDLGNVSMTIAASRHPADAFDPAHPSMAAAAFRPEVVFNLMGLSHINAAQADPMGAFGANVAATWNVLEACRQYRDAGGPLKAVVVSSSNHVYGSLRARRRYATMSPWTERDALEPTDVYGGTKAMADIATRLYGREYGLPAVALRHANAYGPGGPFATHLVPTGVLALLAGEAPRLRGDGSASKDYLYVDDVISAYICCAELAETKAARGQALNAAPATPTSAREVLERLTIVTGHWPDLQPILGTSGEQTGYQEHLDASALHALGWFPVTTLDDGLRKTYEWYEAHGGMKWLD